MKPGQVRTVGFLVAGILAAAFLLAAGERPAAADPDAQLVSTDQAFFAAAARSDRAAVAKLLDADFTWTDAAGATLSRGQLKTYLPKPAFGAGGGAGDKHYTYGDVAVLETDRGKMHTLRVWIRRPAGWRGIVYQEVRSLDAPAANFTGGVTRDCLNPCREIPFTPRTPEQKSVVSAYKAFASATVAKDATAWGASTAEEFVAVSSYSERPTDRTTTLAQLARTSVQAGAPTLVVSAEMFDFPGVVVMRSQQQPEHGKPVHATRLWIERGGRWAITLSYQTAIAAAQPAP